MFNPNLNRETGLHTIGETESSAKIELSHDDAILLIRKYINTLIDFGTKRGVKPGCGLEGAEEEDNLKYMDTVGGLEKYWRQLVMNKFNENVVHLKLPEEHSGEEFIDSPVFQEAFMNAIEYGEAWTRAEPANPIVEAYASRKGTLWIVEQRHGAENFLKKVEPVVHHWAAANPDYTYLNPSGRLRGTRLTDCFSLTKPDQISYEFVQPEGLRVYVLKQNNGNSGHQSEPQPRNESMLN